MVCCPQTRQPTDTSHKGVLWTIILVTEVLGKPGEMVTVFKSPRQLLSLKKQGAQEFDAFNFHRQKFRRTFEVCRDRKRCIVTK